jgi:hypothetical protein
MQRQSLQLHMQGGCMQGCRACMRHQCCSMACHTAAVSSRLPYYSVSRCNLGFAAESCGMLSTQFTHLCCMSTCKPAHNRLRACAGALSAAPLSRTALLPARGRHNKEVKTQSIKNSPTMLLDMMAYSDCLTLEVPLPSAAAAEDCSSASQAQVLAHSRHLQQSSAANVVLT